MKASFNKSLGTYHHMKAPRHNAPNPAKDQTRQNVVPRNTSAHNQKGVQLREKLS